MGHVQVGWARALAESLLAEPLPRRWAHSQGVGAQAETLRSILGSDADLLVSAAWLHDIGYAPSLVATDFHPIDGARYLRDVEYADEMLCRLVAHHTCACIEAEERGLSAEMDEFDAPPSDLADALIYCDMTTGPSGERMDVSNRLAEIDGRYGPDHLVSRSIRRATPALVAAVRATADRLGRLSTDQ
ncbi:HD domain-containing protein [Cryptosporangium phraense]|uniref:HD domain-containing protein n=1 Tax=Cryptosporangium phraense TaxID=2593070 RepID=UPI001F0E7B0D|nr:HD domain-containing protein [Cryptosporangium phraense]